MEDATVGRGGLPWLVRWTPVYGQVGRRQRCLRQGPPAPRWAGANPQDVRMAEVGSRFARHRPPRQNRARMQGTISEKPDQPVSFLRKTSGRPQRN